MRDIGWSEHDARESYVLTMRPLELTVLLRRLREEAAQILIERSTEAESSRRDAEINRRFQLGHEACATVLTDLGARASG